MVVVVVAASTVVAVVAVGGCSVVAVVVAVAVAVVAVMLVMVMVMMAVVAVAVAVAVGVVVVVAGLISSADIGGLDPIIEELKESVIYPLTLPALFASTSTLLAAPKGVLLYGPPGCGKTMLARALARESGACFINLHISTLTEKWYGDSNKLVTAVFSLARKLQPTIVFIDEIDAVLRSRSSTDHEASTMVKAEFMTHWDGLLSTASAGSSGSPAQIMILGATNRIQDIDEAILRRMPKKFSINLPDHTQRKRILGLILKDTKLAPSFDLDELVDKTAGMSGSDLTEACRDAAMVPVREYIKEKLSQNRKLAVAVGGDGVDAGAGPGPGTAAGARPGPGTGAGGPGRGMGLELELGLGSINRDEVRGVENRDFFRRNAGGRRPVEEEIEAFGKIVGEVEERLGKVKRLEDEKLD